MVYSTGKTKNDIALATLTWTNSLSIVQTIGPCNLGDKCRNPHMQLRDANKCNKYREIVHPLCVSMGDFENPTCDLCVHKEKIVEPQDSTSDNQQEVCTILTTTAPRKIVPRTTNNETERSPQPRRNSPRNVVPATPTELSSNSKSLTPKALRNRTRRMSVLLINN